MTSRQLSDYRLPRSLSMGDLRAHDESVKYKIVCCIQFDLGM